MGTRKPADAPVIAVGRRVRVGWLGDKNLERQLGKGPRRHEQQVLALDQVLHVPEQGFAKRMGPDGIEGQWFAAPSVLIGIDAIERRGTGRARSIPGSVCVEPTAKR